jgi:hypothetical protein
LCLPWILYRPDLTLTGWGITPFELSRGCNFIFLSILVDREVYLVNSSGLSLRGLRWKLVLWNNILSYLYPFCIFYETIVLSLLPCFPYVFPLFLVTALVLMLRFRSSGRVFNLLVLCILYFMTTY